MTSLYLFAKQTRTSIGRELSVSFCCCFVVDHRGNTFKVLVIDKPLIGRRAMVGRVVFTFVFGRYRCRMCNKKIVVSMNSVICLVGTCPIMQMSESMDVFFQDFVSWFVVWCFNESLRFATKHQCGLWLVTFFRHGSCSASKLQYLQWSWHVKEFLRLKAPK